MSVDLNGHYDVRRFESDIYDTYSEQPVFYQEKKSGKTNYKHFHTAERACKKWINK